MALVAPNAAFAGPADKSGQQTARYACQDALHGTFDEEGRSGVAAQLKKPDNRIDGQDWSGQDLSGKDFAGKILLRTKLKGARLRGADLTGAIVCDVDLSAADLTGARLDRALIGGGTKMTKADLSRISGRNLKIADADAQDIQVDGADLRDANLVCNPDDQPYCYGSGVAFAGMAGADLRGATVELAPTAPGLRTAHLDRARTHLEDGTEFDFAQLADGVGDGTLTFLPQYGRSGIQTDFTGRELRQLEKLLGSMQAASVHPSFDCTNARTAVEKAICADPKLAALDSALNWLWRRVAHTPEETAAQKAWAATGANCPPEDYVMSANAFSPHAFASRSDPKGCIGIAYAERIRQLAPKAKPAVLGSGTYTTDGPLELPQGADAALARKFIMARGYRQDEITLENLGGGKGKIEGSGLWGNGHICGLEAPEADIERTGARFRINDDPKEPDEKYSVSFAITPQIVLRVGGANQFQCGARGGWSDVYFRQPEQLIKASNKQSKTE